jgi:hypothetical protein
LPASYELDLPKRLVRTRGWGVLTDAEVGDLYERLRRDPAFEPTFQQLCDLRQVTDLQTTVEALRALARRPTFAPGARRAFVVGREVDYGLSRLFQAYAEPKGSLIEVFREWEPAEEWLGIR